MHETLAYPQKCSKSIAKSYPRFRDLYLKWTEPYKCYNLTHCGFPPMWIMQCLLHKALPYYSYHHITPVPGSRNTASLYLSLQPRDDSGHLLLLIPKLPSLVSCFFITCIANFLHQIPSLLQVRSCYTDEETKVQRS